MLKLLRTSEINLGILGFTDDGPTNILWASPGKYGIKDSTREIPLENSDKQISQFGVG